MQASGNPPILMPKQRGQFGHALRNQARVLGAIMRREIHEAIGRGGHQLILGILEPPFGMTKVLFITTGLYSTFIFVHLSCHFRAVAKGSAALRRFPVEKTVDFVLADAFVKVTVYAFAGVLTFGFIYRFYDFEAIPTRPELALLGMLSLILLGFGMGLCNAALEQLFPLWRYFWIPLARGLILFSGVIYVPDNLYVHVRSVLSWNPVLQGLELFRMGFYPGYPRTCFSPGYLWSFCAVLILAGLCADRVFRRKLDEC